MNAFTNSMQKIALQTGRRFASGSTASKKPFVPFSSATAHAAPKKPFVPDVYKKSIKQTYLSNPGNYPLMAVLCGASCFIVAMSANRYMYRSKQAKITSEHKNAVIQDWGKEKVDPVVKRVTKQPIAFNAQGFKSIREEGLGVDHEEWKKGKEADYRRQGE